MHRLKTLGKGFLYDECREKVWAEIPSDQYYEVAEHMRQQLEIGVRKQTSDVIRDYLKELF